MMRKKIVSLCMALVLCLGLLPVTALAAGEDVPGTLYVGQTPITESGYWTTGENGKLTASNENNYNVYYDGNGTLTLNNANIQGGNDSQNPQPQDYGIYAATTSDQSVSLTINLIGSNTVDGHCGICVEAKTGDYATLVIQSNGNDPKGSLVASGSSWNGISVSATQGNASLTINNASVEASSRAQYYHGVSLISYTASNPELSLTVNGGSLTAQGYYGIWYNLGSSTNLSTSLMVSDGALIKGIPNIRASGVGVSKPIPQGNGIVFDGNSGTVYGDVTLQENLEIGEGETLTIPSGSSLNANGKLTNDGTINVQDGGKLEGTPTSGSGTVVNAPTITVQPTNQTVTEGQTASFTVTATGENPTYQWSQSTDQGKSWTEISGATGSTYTTAATTTSMSGYQYRCVVSNSAGSVTSSAATLTVNAATVPVTGVSLTPASLSLFTGDTATLTATVTPENADNKTVTWESSDTSVATVDENGTVTAVGAGTATITVTTEDGNKTATCTVTVTRPYIPPANPNYRITVEATQGGAVTADPTAAKAGTTVTLTPVPDQGYQVGSVAVTDRFGDTVEVTENADGTYTFTMPNGQVTVTVTFAEAPLPFHDVTEGDWFYDAVRYAYETGLMDGVGDGQFAPNATTTRAQLVTILYRLAREPEPGGDSGFSDVAAGTWYTDAVAWAAQKGIVNGISETEFSPSGDLTREQLATILYRYAESMGYDVSAQADLSGFPDAGDIQSYATQALSWAVAEGLLQGFEDDSLQPGGTATRAQIATLLMRFLAAVPTE